MLPVCSGYWIWSGRPSSLPYLGSRGAPQIHSCPAFLGRRAWRVSGPATPQRRLRNRSRSTCPWDKNRSPRDDRNRRILQSTISRIPLHWALQSECTILMLMWSVKPLLVLLGSSYGTYINKPMQNRMFRKLRNRGFKAE